VSESANQSRLSNLLLGSVLLVVTLLALRILAGVFITVALGIFITLACLPLAKRIANALPTGFKWLGLTTAMALLIAIVTTFTGGLIFCVQRIAAKIPELSLDLERMVPNNSGGGGVIGNLQELVRTRGDAIGNTVLKQIEGLAATVASGTGLMITGTVIVLFFVLLALGETDRWRDKMDQVTGGEDWQRVTDTLGRTLREFILVRTFIGFVTAAVYGGWLMFFGVDLILVWATLAFLLTFVPNLGSLLSGVLPTIYAFLTLDFGTAFLVGAGLFAIEQVLGNWLDPKLQGRRVSLSPLVILVSILFWGALWGVAGAFLGTPMTLTIMILCNATLPLRPVALLLSNQSRPEGLDAALGWEDEWGGVDRDVQAVSQD